MDIRVKLQIRKEADRAFAAAILLTGYSADEWIAAICEAGPEAAKAEILLMPAEPDANQSSGANQSENQGVVLIWQDIRTARQFCESLRTRRRPLTGVLYQRIAERLYFPLDAELVPEVTVSEVRVWLADRPGSICLWHPISGLTVWPKASQRSLAELISSPSMNDANWNDAQTGPQLNDRIQWIRPEMRSPGASPIDEGKGDIGESEGNFDDLPSSPNEKPPGPGSRGTRSVRNWIAGQITKWTQSRGKQNEDRAGTEAGAAGGAGAGSGAGAGGGESLISRLRNWAAQVRNEQSQEEQSRLQQQRDNELQRLMDMLEKDPDTGLKYALPMGPGSEDQRRSHSQDGQLEERTPEFDRGGLNSSGEGDAWVVSWQTHAKLIQRYRDLAQREMRLGRYKRAAYIYAHLLRDFDSAASALRAGGLHHDAALVYLEHLRRPLTAAQCFREGGFWEEALQIYLNHSNWLEAADLANELRRYEDSRNYVLKAVDAHISRREFSEAAQLTDQRLDDANEAVAIWYRGWESGSVSGRRCFEQMLQMHARRGSHQAAIRSMHQFVQCHSGRPGMSGAALTVCSAAVVNYPDQQVCDVARSMTWQLAETVLAGDDTTQQQTALTNLRVIAKQDLLLTRDTQRYSDSLLRQNKENSIRQSADRRSLRGMPISATFSLPTSFPGATDTRWTNVVSNGFAVFAIGTANAEQTLVLWRKPIQWLRSEDPSQGSTNILVNQSGHSLSKCQLRTCAVNRSQIWLHRPEADLNWNPGAVRALNDDPAFFKILPTPRSVLFDFRQQADGTIHAIVWDEIEHFSLLTICGLGAIRQSVRILISEMPMQETIRTELIRVTSRNQRIFICFGRTMLSMPVDSEATVDDTVEIERQIIPKIEFPDNPTDIVISPETTATRLVFPLSQGLMAYWESGGASCSFGTDLVEPKATFTYNGICVAVCTASRRIEAYQLISGEAKCVAEASEVNGTSRIVSVIPGPSPNHVVVVTEDGHCYQYLVPVR